MTWRFVIIWNDGRCTSGEHDGNRADVMIRVRNVIGDNGGECFSIVICHPCSSPERVK